MRGHLCPRRDESRADGPGSRTDPASRFPLPDVRRLGPRAGDGRDRAAAAPDLLPHLPRGPARQAPAPGDCVTPAAPDLVVVGGARLDAAAATLAEAGYPVRRGADGPALERLIDEAIPAAILLDAGLPDLPVLLAELSAGCGVIVLTAEPSVDEALEAIRAGAADYLPAGAPLPILARALNRICTVRRLQDDVEFWRSRAAPRQNAMLGQSPVMGALRRTIELVAHAAAPDPHHRRGRHRQIRHRPGDPRDQRPRQPPACRGGPDSTLTPADLFGSEGQGHVGRGILAQAQGGTLLLNDIERLPETIYAPAAAARTGAGAPDRRDAVHRPGHPGDRHDLGRSQGARGRGHVPRRAVLPALDAQGARARAARPARGHPGGRPPSVRDAQLPSATWRSASPPRRSTRWCATPGRGTCASCTTRWTAA